MESTGRLVVLAVLSTLILVYRSIVSKSSTPLPPGPKPKPIIGNLFDLPPQGQHESEHWLKHKEHYGPISSVTVLGQTIVIINDRALALHVLGKNSAENSSRPHLVFAEELSGWGETPLSEDNTSLLRTYRRAMARIIGTQALASKFDPLLETEARRFLWRVLHSPANFIDHNRTAAGAFIMKIIYGYNIRPHGEDPLVSLADLTLQQFSMAIVPGMWLVDVIPALKYLPEWFPGAGFQRTARYFQETLKKLVDHPSTFTKYQMSRKAHQPSFLSELLEQGEADDVAKWSAFALASGGSDTTVAALEGFFLAMSLFSDVQRKAQEEIDRVLGSPVLPTAADKPRLPYVEALVKETLRWHVIAPMGVPHRTDEDDLVGGYLIPKNATLLPNIWAFNHDPAVHPEPSEFRPERFLTKDGQNAEPDPHDTVFGFGRRICPGRFVADTSLFLIIAHTLAIFNIRKPIGPDGKEVEPRVAFTPGIVSHPVHYACTFTVRSAEHESLVLRFAHETPFEEGNAEQLAEALGSH